MLGVGKVMGSRLSPDCVIVKEFDIEPTEALSDARYQQYDKKRECLGRETGATHYQVELGLLEKVVQSKGWLSVMQCGQDL